MHLFSSPSRSRPLRTLASALVALTFATPLLDAAHEASVRHLVCAEHGELVEASRALTHVEPPQTPSGSLSQDSDPGPSSHDDHCFIAAHARQRSLGSGVKPAGAPTLVPLLVSAAPRATPPQTQTLYLLDPKGSPPARA
jgi:hypothetical protein